jgi:hypothetical protein
MWGFKVETSSSGAAYSRQDLHVVKQNLRLWEWLQELKYRLVGSTEPLWTDWLKRKKVVPFDRGGIKLDYALAPAPGSLRIARYPLCEIFASSFKKVAAPERIIRFS